MINGPFSFFKNKILLASNVFFFYIEFIFLSYVIKMLSEITVVLIVLTILIADLGGRAPWVHMPLSFQSLQGPALDPLDA